MDCARCKHRKLIDKARACCLACDPDSSVHSGRVHVRLNEQAVGEGGAMRLASDYRHDSSSDVAVVDALELLRRLASVTYEDLGIVWGILNQMSLSEIARYVGIGSRQSAHKRLRSAIARNPWVADFWATRSRSSRSRP